MDGLKLIEWFRPSEPRKKFPHRRSAARLAVIVRRAELSNRSAGVDAPVVLEVDVQVGVVRRLEREAVVGPVLPPVVIPLEALVVLPHVAIEEPGPRCPRLLVGALQVPEVIDLEAG
jgi:hypothetical protein